MDDGSDVGADTLLQKPQGHRRPSTAGSDATAIAAPASSSRALPSPLEIAAPVLKRGSCIGPFRIVEKLGEGGMGLVFKAYDPVLDRHVAIKVLQSRLFSGLGSNAARERLLREAQAMANVRHPNVITVYSVGTFRSQVYIAMEYIEGDTLRDWIDAGDQDWRDAVKLLRDAGNGLAAAHESGFVHRDFKPANVLLGTADRVLVTDFGLVSSESDPEQLEGSARNSLERPAVDPNSVSLTKTGTILGTPPYMAPEQHRGEPADARADQFAFCVTLYEALYGERPHRGSEYSELVGNIVNGTLKPTPRGTEVPDWVHDVVVRGLATAPDDRFDSMSDLLNALAMEPVQRPWWRGRLGAMALAAGVLGIFVALRWPTSDAPSANVVVTLNTRPAGGRLYIDDVYVGSDGLSIRRTTGSEFSVRCQLDGFRDGAIAVRFDEQSTYLCPLGAPTTPPTAASIKRRLLLLTSSPPALELYREDTGARIATTPFFGYLYPKEHVMEPGDCVFTMEARLGNIASIVVLDACSGAQEVHIELDTSRLDVDSVAPVAAPPLCDRELLALSHAIQRRESDPLSKAWSEISVCFANQGLLQEADYAMSAMSKVLQDRQGEDKRVAQNAQVAFRRAQLLWRRGSEQDALMEARSAILWNRLIKHDLEEAKVLQWLHGRGALRDLRIDLHGASADPIRIRGWLFRGQLEIGETIDEISKANEDRVLALSDTSGPGLDTKMTFALLPPGEFTLCAEAIDGSSGQKAFGCAYVQHHPTRAETHVLQLQLPTR